MESYSNSLQIFSMMMMIMTALLSHVSALPVNLTNSVQNSHMLETYRVSSRAELNSIVNHTVPSILTAGVNPYEYLRLRGHNVTGLNILDYLRSNEVGQNGHQSPGSFEATPSCPETWVVNIKSESLRDPPRIQRAVCNGPGSTCLLNGRPNCKEFRSTFSVLVFLGIDQDGRQVWQKQYWHIPIACHCTSK